MGVAATCMAPGGGAKPTFICSSPLVNQRGMKMADRVGQQFGDYRLTRFLGRGSFGDVYLGEHVHDDTLSAIKVLQARLTPEDLKEFINEVGTTFRPQHPNIVRLLDFGIGADD